MELDSIAKHKSAFYRLVGTTSDDDSLVENGETEDDVFYLFITRGYRSAQRYLIDFCGMSNRWRTRSSAISWSGSESTDGGQYTALPSDLLRLAGDMKRSPLVEADGTKWGQLIGEEDSLVRGNYFYLKNDQLWKTRGASPPSTIYLEYHHHHAVITSATSTFDLPAEARHLAVAFAANDAMTDNWFPGKDRSVVREALVNAKYEAKQLRRTREPLQMKAPRQSGVAW